jgi:hypothetical protein
VLNAFWMEAFIAATCRTHLAKRAFHYGDVLDFYPIRAFSLCRTPILELCFPSFHLFVFLSSCLLLFQVDLQVC